jgi:peptidoglycan hydrolase FlgJ
MTTPVNFYADFKGLNALKSAAGQDDPKAVREVARQFESVFTKMMLKSMRDANLGDGMFDSDQTKFYQDMFDNQMSVQLSRGKGLGLADLLVKQLTVGGLKPATATKSDAIKSDAVKSSVNSATSNLQNVVGAHKSIPLNAVDLSKVKLTKGGAESGNKDVQGVTLSAPNSPQSQAPTKSTQTPAAKAVEKTSNTEKTGSTAQSVDGPRTNLRQALTQTPDEFIAAMWPYAQKAAAELGVDAKTLIAHAALETGWGKSVPCNPDGSCSFNLFGIKAGQTWKGNSLDVSTTEYEGGVAVQRNENFRSYASPEDSFRDYAAFLKNSPRYTNAVGTGTDTAKFANALQQGGYATDPLYANKLTAAAHGVTSRVDSALKTSSIQPLASSSSASSPLASDGGVTTQQTRET